jgi:acyl-CoA oxidase
MVKKTDYAELRGRLKSLSKTPIFQKDTLSFSKQEKVSYLYALMEMVVKESNVRADDITDDMGKLLTVMESPCLMSNYGLCPLLASHYNLCLGTIMNLAGSNRHHLQGYIDELEQLETKGIYMVTEIDHGNNAMSMQTEARFDKEKQEFIINTPYPGACKFMPYLSSEEQPKLAIVMARLWLEDQDCGVHPFIVRCRDKQGRLLKGVKASKLSAVDLYSVSDVDHSITAFEQVRIPYYAFLGGELNQVTPDGKFITRAKSQREIFFNSLCRVEWGKIVLTAALMSPIKMAVTIAIEYARRRKVANRRGSHSLTEFQFHKLELAKAYVYLIASVSLYEKRKDICLHQKMELETLAMNAAIIKSMCVEMARDALNICLARTGAQGKMVRNRVISACILNDITSTAEGDSVPVLMKIAKELITGGGLLPFSEEKADAPIASSDRLFTLLATREKALKSQLQQEISESTDRDLAWNNATPIAQELAWVHGIRNAADALAEREAIQTTFCSLYILQHAAWYSANELISASEMRELIGYTQRSLPAIFDEQAINVASEFELHDLIELTAIGSADMPEYWLRVAEFGGNSEASEHLASGIGERC